MLQAIAHGRILADELDAAQDYAKTSLEIGQRTGDRFGSAEARNLAAELALMNGDLQATIDHLEWAYGFWRTHHGDHTGLVQARLLPWCYFFAGQVEQSERLAGHLLFVTDPETAVGDHALVLRLLALPACVRGGKERCQDLMEQSETLLARDDVGTMRGEFCDDRQWRLLSDCAAAIAHCLNREFGRSKAITERLLGLRMTHLRPFILQLLFTVDLLTLYLQEKELADEALAS